MLFDLVKISEPFEDVLAQKKKPKSNCTKNKLVLDQKNTFSIDFSCMFTMFMLCDISDVDVYMPDLLKNTVVCIEGKFGPR